MSEMSLGERMEKQGNFIVSASGREDEAPTMTSRWGVNDFMFIREDGGPGSGNFGHEGRPGEVGGSAPSDESKAKDSFSKKEQKIVDAMKFKGGSGNVYKDLESAAEVKDGKKNYHEVRFKDGRVIQSHGFSSMKEVLKDIKKNADDDGKMGDMSVWIKYRNGTEASYKAGDNIMEMKTSDIAAAMVKQGNAQYGYGAEFDLTKQEAPKPAKPPEEPKEKKPAEKADKPKEKKAEAKVEPATASGSAELKKAPYLESKASTLDDAQRASYEKQFSALKKENTDLQRFMDGVNYKVPNYDPTPFKNADNRKKEIKAEAEQLVDKMPEGALISKGTVVYEKVADGKWIGHSPNRTYDTSKGYLANELCGASDTEDYPPITFLASTDDAKMVRDIQLHDDETYTDWAAALNGSERKDLVKRAKKDPQFKELVDAVVMYTEGAYTDQRKVAQDLVKNGLNDADAQTVGEMANGNLYEFRDLWKGQSLKTSDSSIAGGMAHMIEAVNHSAPYEGTLYRVAQDRRLIKQDATTCWEPPKPGDKIRMDAPTSFTSDYDVEQEISKNKMGDIIHYELESGANALNVAALSRYKQAELLCCGEFEVVSCETKTQTIPIYNEPTEAQKKRGIKENQWGDKYFERYIATVKIRQVDKCKIGNRTDEEVVYVDCADHFDSPMLTFDCLAEGILEDRNDAGAKNTIERLTSELTGDNSEYASQLLQAIAKLSAYKADGGPGSGNHGHKGVPGQVGGSAPSDKSSSRITETMKSERKTVSIKRPTEEQIRKATSRFGLEAYFEIESKHSEELDAAIESGDQTAYKAIKKKCQAEYDKMRENVLRDLPSYMEEGYYVSAKNVDDETAEVFARQGFDSESGSFKMRGVASADKGDDVESVYLGKDFVKISEEEAKARFAAQYLGRKDEGTFGGLSKDDERTISLYTYATAANSALRKGEHSEQADKLKSIIDRTVSPERTVYRGLAGGDFTQEVLAKEAGDTITDKGFMSTSYEKDVAKSFAGDNGAILEIRVPEGFGKSIDVTSYSNKPDENEVLLNAGTTLRIVSKDGNHIVCEFADAESRDDGGPGSGNFGHEGRPGEVGGSAPAEENTVGASDKPAPITKKRVNASIAKIASSDKDFDTKVAEIKKEIEKLPKGSKITFPDSWNDDDGRKQIAVWDGHTWAVNGGWNAKNGYNCSPDEMLNYLATEDESERPQITSVAMTEEKKQQEAIERQKKNDPFRKMQNGGKPETYRSKYGSEAEYQEARKKAEDKFDSDISGIDSEYGERLKSVQSKIDNANFSDRRFALYTDESLSDEERNAKLDAIDAERHELLEEKNTIEREQHEARQKAKKEWQRSFEADYELKAKDQDYTLRDDAYAVNPNYISDSHCRSNCYKCGLAWELRCRGYDIEALADESGSGGVATMAAMRQVFKDGENVKVDGGGQNATASVIDQMKAWGDGARAVITTYCSNAMGHVYNVMNRDGNIIFVDSQSGAIQDTNTQGEDITVGNIERSFSADLFRVDQSHIYELPDKWVKNR